MKKQIDTKAVEYDIIIQVERKSRKDSCPMGRSHGYEERSALAFDRSKALSCGEGVCRPADS